MSTRMSSDGPYEKLVSVKMSREEMEQRYQAQKYYRIVLLIPTLLLSLMVLQTLLLPRPLHTHSDVCTDPCRLVLLESIPEGLDFNSSTTNPSIYQAWLNLIGEHILSELTRLSKKESGVSVRIAVSLPQESQPQEDINILSNAGADVRKVNMRELTSGVLHTKFWVVDKKHIYIGSANMDWRSLTQVKELGAVVYNCSCLAEDLGKIFEAYWYLGEPGKRIPSHWPASYSTLFNKDAPLQLPLNGTSSTAYLSSSPPALCADGRTQDLNAILSVIDDAQRFVYISVMNYLPTMEFSQPKRYWAEIDTQLRRVAYERRVRVRLLISCWGSTQPVMIPFLRSLASLSDPKGKLDVQVKLFVVPANPRQKEIPYARVNHNKYMVTDKVAYIGTSNWSGDYFMHTAGSALVVNQTSAQSTDPTVQEQLQAVFERDWDSAYSSPVNQHTDFNIAC